MYKHYNHLKLFLYFDLPNRPRTQVVGKENAVQYGFKINASDNSILKSHFVCLAPSGGAGVDWKY